MRSSPSSSARLVATALRPFFSVLFVCWCCLCSSFFPVNPKRSTERLNISRVLPFLGLQRLPLKANLPPSIRPAFTGALGSQATTGTPRLRSGARRRTITARVPAAFAKDSIRFTPRKTEPPGILVENSILSSRLPWGKQTHNCKMLWFESLSAPQCHARSGAAKVSKTPLCDIMQARTSMCLSGASCDFGRIHRRLLQCVVKCSA